MKRFPLQISAQTHPSQEGFYVRNTYRFVIILIIAHSLNINWKDLVGIDFIFANCLETLREYVLAIHEE